MASSANNNNSTIVTLAAKIEHVNQFGNQYDLQFTVADFSDLKDKKITAFEKQQQAELIVFMNKQQKDLEDFKRQQNENYEAGVTGLYTKIVEKQTEEGKKRQEEEKKKQQDMEKIMFEGKTIMAKQTIAPVLPAVVPAVVPAVNPVVSAVNPPPK